MFERVALIGLGLMGSSIARAVGRAKLARGIVGSDISAGVRAKVTEMGIIDRVEETPEAAVAGADLIVLCTPLGTYRDIARAIGPKLAPGAILSDVGSVKQSAIRDIAPFVPEGVHFIPGHPVAGIEKSGPEAGFAGLFENRWCIMTPAPEVAPEAVDKLTRFWEALGSRVEIMEPGHHDIVLGITSHVPHLIAYNIVGTAADIETVTESEVIKYSAGGFRDFTRIAASDPTMWRDIFLANQDAVLEVLGRFIEDLTALKRAIRWGDGDLLYDLFARTREIRRGIIDAGQETEEPDFGRPHSD